MARALGTVSPDDLGGVCVYRCQIKKLCDAGLLMRVGYGRYQIGPAADAALPEELEGDQLIDREAA